MTKISRVKKKIPEVASTVCKWLIKRLVLVGDSGSNKHLKLLQWKSYKGARWCVTCAHRRFDCCTPVFQWLSQLLLQILYLCCFWFTRKYHRGNIFYYNTSFFFFSIVLADMWGSRKKAEQEYCRGKREEWCREGVSDGLPHKGLMCTLTQAHYFRKGVRHCWIG